MSDIVTMNGTHPEAYAPPLSWAIEAGRRAPVGALKVAPGIPHEAVPAADKDPDNNSDNSETNTGSWANRCRLA